MARVGGERGFERALGGVDVLAVVEEGRRGARLQVAADGGVEAGRGVDGLDERGQGGADRAALERQRLVERQQGVVTRLGGRVRVDQQAGRVGEPAQPDQGANEAEPRLEPLGREGEGGRVALRRRREILDARLEQVAAPLVQVGERERRRAAGRDGLAERARRAREVSGRLREAQQLAFELGVRARERQRRAQPGERPLLIACAGLRAGRGVLEDARALARVGRARQPQRHEVEQQLPRVGLGGGRGQPLRHGRRAPTVRRAAPAARPAPRRGPGRRRGRARTTRSPRTRR